MGAGGRLIGVFRAITSFAFSPLTAGIMAVGLVLSSVVSTVQSNWEQISTFFSGIGDQLSSTVSTAFESLQPAIGRVQEAWGQLQAAFGEDTALGQAISSLQEAIGSGLVTAVMAVVQIFADFVSTGVMMFTAILDAALNFTATLISLFAAVFQGDIPGILNGIPNVFAAAFNGARAVAEAALNGILSIVQSIVSAISSISFSGLSSAAANASAAVTGAVSGIGGHAEGGIFAKGAHLTWFAEDSAEAAIPIDGSKRAIELWHKTGQLLGILPTERQKDSQSLSALTSSNAFNSFNAVNAINAANAVNDSQSLSAMTSSNAVNAINAVNDSQSLSAMTVGGEGNLESRLNEYERLNSQTMSLTMSTTTSNPSMPITLQFTFNGPVNREDVQRGVEDSLPRLKETFEEQMARYKHEVSRRSF